MSFKFSDLPKSGGVCGEHIIRGARVGLGSWRALGQRGCAERGRAALTGTTCGKREGASSCQELAGPPRRAAIAMRKVTQETLHFPEQWRGMAKSVLYELEFTKRKSILSAAASDRMRIVGFCIQNQISLNWQAATSANVKSSSKLWEREFTPCWKQQWNHTASFLAAGSLCTALNVFAVPE